MMSIKVGFWDDYAEQKEEYEDAYWWFLVGVFSSHGFNPYNFLHGNCNVFAQYLNEEYGYPVECVFEKRPDEPRKLVHAYCVTPVGYMDVRGVCSDYEEFMQNFYDNGLWDNDDYSYTKKYSHMPKSLREAKSSEAYQAAKAIDKEFGYYDKTLVNYYAE